MGLKQAFKTGLITIAPMALVGWVISFLLSVNSKLWSVVPMPEGLLAYRWTLNVAMSIVIIILVGYLVRLFHPIKRLLNRFPFLALLKTQRQENSNAEWPVVRVRWAGLLVMGWLDEIRLDYYGEIEYKVTAASAPLPISGNLLFAGIDEIEFSNLTTPDYLRQLGSFGFKKLPPHTKFVPGTEFPREELTLDAPPKV